MNLIQVICCCQHKPPHCTVFPDIIFHADWQTLANYIANFRQKRVRRAIDEPQDGKPTLYRLARVRQTHRYNSCDGCSDCDVHCHCNIYWLIWLLTCALRDSSDFADTIVIENGVDCAYSSGSSNAEGNPRMDEACDEVHSAWGGVVDAEVHRTWILHSNRWEELVHQVLRIC